MIIIQNMGPHGQDDPGGVRDYELRVNNLLIGRFKHARRDGLGECLRRAAQAADESDKTDRASLEKLAERLEL